MKNDVAQKKIYKVRIIKIISMKEFEKCERCNSATLKLENRRSGYNEYIKGPSRLNGLSVFMPWGLIKYADTRGMANMISAVKTEKNDSFVIVLILEFDDLVRNKISERTDKISNGDAISFSWAANAAITILSRNNPLSDSVHPLMINNAANTPGNCEMAS